MVIQEHQVAGSQIAGCTPVRIDRVTRHLGYAA